MEVVVLNLGDADKSSDLEILDLLNVLFSATTTPEEKKQRLHNEFESEVQEMCNLSEALVEQGIELGKEERNLSMAQMMIQEREPVEKIEKYTGYTLEKLKFFTNICSGMNPIKTYWNIIFIFHPTKDRKLNDFILASVT